MQGANIRSCLERSIIMSSQEKLIQYIKNLSDEEAENIIAYLKTVPSFEEVVPPLLPYNYLQEQVI